MLIQKKGGHAYKQETWAGFLNLQPMGAYWECIVEPSSPPASLDRERASGRHSSPWAELLQICHWASFEIWLQTSLPPGFFFIIMTHRWLFGHLSFTGIAPTPVFFILESFRPLDNREHSLVCMKLSLKLDFDEACWTELKPSWVPETKVLLYLEFWWASSLLEKLWTRGYKDEQKQSFKERFEQKWFAEVFLVFRSLKLWYHVRKESIWCERVIETEYGRV